MKITREICLALALASAQIASAETHQNTGIRDITIADPAGIRPLNGKIWYPTTDTGPLAKHQGNAVWKAIYAIENATADKGPRPLVILSHGINGQTANLAWLAQELTDRGYLVAGVDHPGSTLFNKDADQRRRLWERQRDVSRLIDDLTRNPMTRDLFDHNRIFMAGHSLGGMTAVWLAGARFDPAKTDAFCNENTENIVCSILDEWKVAQTPEDREMIAQDWSDPRINAFVALDTGGTPTFSKESLALIDRPMLIYGAPALTDYSLMDQDKESRSLAADLSDGIGTHLEPKGYSHFDFMGECTRMGYFLLRIMEPADAPVCQDGRSTRAARHQETANRIDAFFQETEKTSLAQAKN